MSELPAQEDFIAPGATESTPVTENASVPIDSEQIGRWLSVFTEGRPVIEIRALNTPKGTTWRRFADPREAAENAHALSGRASGVYFVLNPLRDGVDPRQSARDADIAGREWLYIDADPNRKAGTSATAEEKAAAQAKIVEVRDWLRAKGAPQPIEGDSGNGFHLHYSICLPNDAASRKLIEAVLKALSRRFSDDVVKIDTAMFTAARICKLYGTKACKGPDTPERPHRNSRLLKVPDVIEPFPTALLEELARSVPATATQTFDFDHELPLADAAGDAPDEAHGPMEAALETSAVEAVEAHGTNHAALAPPLDVEAVEAHGTNHAALETSTGAASNGHDPTATTTATASANNGSTANAATSRTAKPARDGGKAKAKGSKAWVGKTVGEDFLERASWASILEPHGWTVAKTFDDGKIWWTRPGKPTEAGWSASTNHNGRDDLFVFSDDAAPFEPNKGYDKLRVYAALNCGGDLLKSKRKLYHSDEQYGDRQPRRPKGKGKTSGAPSSNGSVSDGLSPGGSGAGGEDDTHAALLLSIAASAELARAGDGRTYARFPVGGHHEVCEIRSSGFKRWLIHKFYKAFDGPPSGEGLSGALSVLEARAQYEGKVVTVRVRVAPTPDGGVLIDLGDDSWTAVKVDPKGQGWEVIPHPSDVWFLRPRGLRPLPVPEPGGELADLQALVNVAKEGFPLVVSWLTASLLPAGPYPILALSGEQGTAKSTLAKVLRRLIDPHVCLLRSEPKENRDLMITATNSWVVALDNLTRLYPWLSDSLCRLSTGGGFACRMLYSDSDEVFFEASRPVIMTGIEDYVERGDLADRAIFLTLAAIPKKNRRAEAEFWPAFDAAHPKIFGAVLTAVSKGLARRPEIKLDELPRMGDFGIWGEACCRANGWEAGEFTTAYDANRRGAVEAALEDSLIAGAIRKFMACSDGPVRRDGLVTWEGTARDLLGLIVPKDPPKRSRWPKTPRGLSGQVTRIAPALRAVGIEVTFFQESTGRRRRIVRIDWKSIPIPDTEQPVPPVPPVPQNINPCPDSGSDEHVGAAAGPPNPFQCVRPGAEVAGPGAEHVGTDRALDPLTQCVRLNHNQGNELCAAERVERVERVVPPIEGDDPPSAPTCAEPNLVDTGWPDEEFEPAVEDDEGWEAAAEDDGWADDDDQDDDGDDDMEEFLP